MDEEGIRERLHSPKDGQGDEPIQSRAYVTQPDQYMSISAVFSTFYSIKKKYIYTFCFARDKAILSEISYY
jgi:hypothetical protein